MNSTKLKDEDFEHVVEKNRKATFKNWGYEQSAMAEAGFMHVSGDAVRCVVCFKELEGWEPEDEPWKEHRKHTVDAGMDCEFIKMGKTQSEMTVTDFLRLCKARHKNLVRKKGEAQIADFENIAGSVRDSLENL